MPRTTRAALRSKELEEEEATAASVPLPTTPQKERVPLGEIADNKGVGLTLVDSAENEPLKHGAKKGRKTKVAKKGNNKKTKNDREEPEVEILEDGNQSSSSSAAEEAREELMGTKGAQTFTVNDDGPQAPTSPAANMASKQMNSTVAPKSDPEVHRPSPEISEKKDADGSLEEKIEMRTPKKPTVPSDYNGDEAKEDSFVEQIKSRSPAKRVSRIEDSVEALDKLEEEIEKAGQAITPPPTADGLPATTSPKANTSVKAKSAAKNGSKQNGKLLKGPAHVQKGTAPARKNDPPKASNGASKPTVRPSTTIVKPKENRASLLRQGIKPASPARMPKAPPVVPKATAPPAKRVSSVTKTPFQPAKATAPPAKRVSSVTKTPFQPAKSTKAPTQTSFSLPGEAISQKLKAQKEERLKREEEERLKKKSFKARPVQLSQAPEVRMTAATKARLSMAKNPSERPQTSTKRPSTLASSVSSLSTNKRMSSLTVAKRSDHLANSTAKRAPSMNRLIGSRQSSVPGEPRAAPTAEDLAHQKVKGKEAFSRPKYEIAAREKERKDKEAAARKARIEAAERGRVASREWAEKQKAKKMAEIVAKQVATP